MLGTITVAGIVLLAVLVVLFLWMRRQDQLSSMLEKRRASSQLVSRAEFSAGLERIPVAVALTSEHLYYENPDMQADLELNRIEEIEYDDETVTGHAVPEGSRVMRVRSHGSAFEFVMPQAEAVKWQAALPPKSNARHAASRVG